MEVEHRLIKTNGITLHVALAGPDNGELVLLLHGFPEFWYGWRNQIEPLVAAGFRVAAPDQRGYNESDKPEGVAAYAVPNMVADAASLIRALGRESAYVVGHDWGANVAWWLALTHPQMVKKLVIMNVPHPAVFEKTVRSSLRQMRKSWYIFAMQIPWLPERRLAAGNFAPLMHAFKSSAKPTTFSPDDLVEYRKSWGRAGALTAIINWYRAAVRKPSPKPASWLLSMPVLMIWGAQDVALDKMMAQPSIDLCSDGRLVIIDDATHWVQHDAAAQVNDLLLEFIGRD